MPSPSRRRALRPDRIDGLKVRNTDSTTLTDVEFTRALRMLARMMVRSHHADRDDQAIAAAMPTPSTLTVLPHRSPDHDTNEAA